MKHAIRSAFYSPKRKSSRGFTVLELLVCVAIIALLVALLLPAVQQTQNVARLVSCRNNLRQVGVAMQSFLDQHRKFPGVQYPRELLPFVEQAGLARRIEGRTIIFFDVNGDALSHAKPIADASVPVYACPSDPVQAIARGRMPSYLINAGKGGGSLEDGFFREQGSLRAADVTDGLSNTVAFSERLLYQAAHSPDSPATAAELSRDHRLRTTATTDKFFGIDQLASFRSACESPVWFPGASTTITSITHSGDPPGYNHIMPPNNNSCFNNLPTPGGPNDLGHPLACRTATSAHNGGVNSLLGDGSVHFTSETIDNNVWLALGTRNGGESVNSPGF